LDPGSNKIGGILEISVDPIMGSDSSSSKTEVSTTFVALVSFVTFLILF
jgi:hypothetical protein